MWSSLGVRVRFGVKVRIKDRVKVRVIYLASG